MIQEASSSWFAPSSKSNMSSGRTVTMTVWSKAVNITARLTNATRNQGCFSDLMCVSISLYNGATIDTGSSKELNRKIRITGSLSLGIIGPDSRIFSIRLDVGDIHISISTSSIGVAPGISVARASVIIVPVN